MEANSGLANGRNKLFFLQSLEKIYFIQAGIFLEKRWWNIHEQLIEDKLIISNISFTADFFDTCSEDMFVCIFHWQDVNYGPAFKSRENTSSAYFNGRFQ